MLRYGDVLISLQNAIHHSALARRLAGLVMAYQEQVADVTFTVGTESGGNAIVVNCQFKDELGSPITRRSGVRLLLLADANGDAFNANDYTIAAGTAGAVAEVAADKILECLTEADGTLDVSLTITGGKSCYLAWVGPGGKLVVSSVITHAA